jgi:hypothetical protein
VLPSDQVDVVGTPEQTLFRGSIPGPHFPLSTLRLQPYDRKRMTRGRCDSLNLHRMKLSFTTFRRFYRRTNYEVYLMWVGIDAGGIRDEKYLFFELVPYNTSGEVAL